MSGAAPIVGAGDATGAAVARAFASKALTACVSRRATNADKLEALAQSIRDHDLLARAFAGDARDEDDVAADKRAMDQARGLTPVARGYGLNESGKRDLLTLGIGE